MSLGFTGWDGDGVRHVLQNMRRRDAREVFALLPEDDPDLCFMAMRQFRDVSIFTELAWTPNLLGSPCGFVNIVPRTPGVATGQMLCTDRISRADLLRWADRLETIVLGVCKAAGIHRIQCSVLAEHTDAKVFLARSGWKYEGPEQQLGRAGEDYERWVALASDFETQDPENKEI